MIFDGVVFVCDAIKSTYDGNEDCGSRIVSRNVESGPHEKVFMSQMRKQRLHFMACIKYLASVYLGMPGSTYQN